MTRQMNPAHKCCANCLHFREAADGWGLCTLTDAEPNRAACCRRFDNKHVRFQA